MTAYEVQVKSAFASNRVESDWSDPQRFSQPDEFRAEYVGGGPPTMLDGPEVRLLKWLARAAYRGDGAIVDLGCWLGGSTAALVDGLRENSRRAARSRRVQTYDRFRWERLYDRYNLGFTHEAGESFLADFERLVEPWREDVDLHVGDIAAAQWPGELIEILFVDIMKDFAGAKAVAVNFFPQLIPNQSYLIHQDFKYEFTFWIHLMMYLLRDYVVPVLNLADACTVVFQPIAVPNRQVIDAACDFGALSPADVDAAFDYSESMITGSTSDLREEVAKARRRAKAVLFPETGLGHAQ
jgi:hypothetical protein